MQIVTETLLELGVKANEEINEQQLVLLGIEESNKTDWIALSLGKQLSDARAELFVLIGGIKAKVARERIIKNYKALQKFRKEDVSVEEAVEDITPAPLG